MQAELIIATLNVVVLAIGGFIALRTYSRDSTLRRMEWLYRFYERFYENDRFKPIRRILDYEPPDEIESLKDDVKQMRGSERHEALVDYLNFFELIAVQIKKGSLTQDEALEMFGYYICRLRDHQFIIDYLRPNGFENLHALLSRLKRTGVKR